MTARFAIYEPGDGPRPIRRIFTGKPHHAARQARGGEAMAPCPDTVVHPRDGEVIDGECRRKPASLDDEKITAKARVDAKAAAERARVLSLEAVVSLLAEAVTNPDSDAKAKVAEWRARADAIEAARQDAHKAVGTAETADAARAAADSFRASQAR